MRPDRKFVLGEEKSDESVSGSCTVEPYGGVERREATDLQLVVCVHRILQSIFSPLKQTNRQMFCELAAFPVAKVMVKQIVGPWALVCC